MGGLQGFKKAIGIKFSADLPVNKCSINIHSFETELVEAVRRAEGSSVIVRKPAFRNAELELLEEDVACPKPDWESPLQSKA